MIYKKNKWFSRNAFVSLIDEEKIVANPSLHPTPSEVSHQPWEACRCPDLPPLAPPKLSSLSPSPAQVPGRRDKAHVVGKQLTKVYSKCSELNKRKCVFDKYCFAWQPAHVSIQRWRAPIVQCQLSDKCIPHFYIPVFQENCCGSQERTSEMLGNQLRNQPSHTNILSEKELTNLHKGTCPGRA